MTRTTRTRTVVLDARCIDNLPYGVGRYATEMITRLPALRPSWRWHILRQGKPARTTRRNVTEHRLDIPFASYAQEQASIAPLLDRLAPDLVHSLWFPILETARCPRILTVQDTIAFRGYPEFMQDEGVRQLPWYRRSCVAADRIITPSQASLRDLCDIHSLSATTMRVIPLAASKTFREITSARIAERKAIYGLPERYIFVSSHYRTSYKNIDVVFHAVRLLRERGVDVPPLVSTGFHVPGRDDTWIRLRIIPDAELAGVVAGAEFMVYPSIDEGFGLPPLEAMTCGVPVICSPAGSLPEVGGDAVFYFNPHDGRQLAASMRLFLEDPATRRLYADRGARRAATFSWKRTATETLRLYDETLQSLPGKCRPRTTTAWQALAAAQAAIPPAFATPGHAGQYVTMALNLLAKGNISAALAALETDRRAFPSNPDTLRELGKLYKVRQDWRPAAACFRSMLKAARDNGFTDHLRSALYHLGDCELNLGHPARAARLLRECLNLCPDHTTAPGLLARAIAGARTAARRRS